jgi:hypothetical protein
MDMLCIPRSSKGHLHWSGKDCFVFSHAIGEQYQLTLVKQSILDEPSDSGMHFGCYPQLAFFFALAGELKTEVDVVSRSRTSLNHLAQADDPHIDAAVIEP